MSTSAPAKMSGRVSGNSIHERRPVSRFFNLPIVTGTPVLIAVLVLINLVCFYPSLRGYFLADDFVHLAYVAGVFKGNSDVLLRNFFSTWMQAQGVQFYRPFYTLTLAIDYSIAGANPFVFHLSNLIFHTATCCFLFLLTRRLLAEYGRAHATVAAFFAGAIFAVFPLSGEVISWVSARGDSLCAMFYLAAFWLFARSLKERSRWSLALSLAACSASLLSKEMAVTLPATFSLYALMASPAGTSWHKRLAWSITRTWAFWAITGGYLILRTMALGTITGGYDGSIGEALSTSVFKRWVLDGSFLKVMFPFNAEIFSPRNCLRTALVALYAAGALSLTARLATVGVTRYALFVAAWFSISMVPTYQVWNLTDKLQGSRFIYLGTAPLALLIVLLVYPLIKPGLEPHRVRRLLMLFGVFVLGGFLVCFCAIAHRNNLVWVEASSQVKALKQQIESSIGGMRPDQKLVVLNLPQEHHGAHMLYNGAMLSGLLTPPLSKENIAARVVTFEPMLFGSSDLIVSSRLRRLAAQPDKYSFVTFDQAGSRLIPVKLDSSQANVTVDTSEAGLVITDPRAPKCLVSPALNLPSTATDFVDVELSCRLTNDQGKTPAAPPVMLIKWTSDHAPSLSSAPQLARLLTTDGQVHRYRFSVSEQKKWASSGRILHLALVFLPGRYSCEVTGVRLANGAREIPVLEPDSHALKEDPSGVNRMNSGVTALSYDVSRLKGSSSVIVELSRPNAFFEHYSGTYRDTTLSPHAFKRFDLAPLTGRFEMAAAEFPGGGYYQLRVAAVGADNRITGYVSDPVNLQVTSAQITASRKARKEGGAGRVD